MACHSCSMPTIEGFTQMPQTEYFNKGGDYQCQAQPSQGCIYTAQGEMVCSGGKKSAGLGGLLGTIVENFTGTPEKTKEAFPRTI